MARMHYRIVDVREAPSVDLARVGQQDTQVTWVETLQLPPPADGAAPLDLQTAQLAQTPRGFLLRLPGTDLSPARVREAVEAEVRKRVGVVGLEGTVGP